MKKVSSVLLLCLLVSVLCVFSSAGENAPPEITVQPVSAEVGINDVASVTCSAAGAGSATWFRIGTDGFLTRIGKGDEKTVDGVLISNLKLSTKTAGFAGEYFCVFGNEAGASESAHADISLRINLWRNDDKCDCLYPENKVCAVLCAEGAEENDGEWFKVGTDGSFTPVTGERFFSSGNYLIISDLIPEDCGYYVKSITTQNGRIYSDKINVQFNPNDVQSKYVKEIMLTGLSKPEYGKKAPSVKSAESKKYSVVSCEWSGTDAGGKITSRSPSLTVTVKANEGYSLQYQNYKLSGRCGDVVLSAEKSPTPSYITDTVTLTVSFNLPQKSTPAVFPADKIAVKGNTVTLPSGFTVSEVIGGKNVTFGGGEITFEGEIPSSVFAVLSDGKSLCASLLKPEQPIEPKDTSDDTSEDTSDAETTAYIPSDTDPAFSDDTTDPADTGRTGTDTDNPAKHKHTYDGYRHDETEHWKECSCGYTAYRGNHRGGKATCTEHAVCSVCGAEYGELKDHKYVKGVCQYCGKAEPTGTDTQSASPGETSVTTGRQSKDPAGTTGEGTDIIVIDHTSRPSDPLIIYLLIIICLCLAAATVALVLAKKKK